MRLTHMLPKRPQPSLEVVANSNYGKFRVFGPNLQKQEYCPRPPIFEKFQIFRFREMPVTHMPPKRPQPSLEV